MSAEITEGKSIFIDEWLVKIRSAAKLETWSGSSQSDRRKGDSSNMQNSNECHEAMRAWHRIKHVLDWMMYLKVRFQWYTGHLGERGETEKKRSKTFHRFVFPPKRVIQLQSVKKENGFQSIICASRGSGANEEIYPDFHSGWCWGI